MQLSKLIILCAHVDACVCALVQMRKLYQNMHVADMVSAKKKFAAADARGRSNVGYVNSYSVMNTWSSASVVFDAMPHCVHIARKINGAAASGCKGVACVWIGNPCEGWYAAIDAGSEATCFLLSWWIIKNPWWNRSLRSGYKSPVHASNVRNYVRVQ